MLMFQQIVVRRYDYVVVCYLLVGDDVDDGGKIVEIVLLFEKIDFVLLHGLLLLGSAGRLFSC